MKVSAKQIFVGILTLLVTLGGLRAVEWVYVNSAVRTPLIQSAEKIPGVTHVVVGKTGSIYVHMKPNGNLMSVYEKVSQAARTTFGKNHIKVTFAQNPSSSQSQVASKMRFIIAQGEATGHYVAMDQSIQSLAKSEHVGAQVQMGLSHVYITLSAGMHRDYTVIPVTIGGGSRG